VKQQQHLLHLDRPSEILVNKSDIFKKFNSDGTTEDEVISNGMNYMDKGPAPNSSHFARFSVAEQKPTPPMD